MIKPDKNPYRVNFGCMLLFGACTLMSLFRYFIPTSFLPSVAYLISTVFWLTLFIIMLIALGKYHEQLEAFDAWVIEIAKPLPTLILPLAATLPTDTPTIYERVVTTPTLVEIADEAVLAGAEWVSDIYDGTVKITYHDTIIFFVKAKTKGDEWTVHYSSNYYEFVDAPCQEATAN